MRNKIVNLLLYSMSLVILLTGCSVVPSNDAAVKPELLEPIRLAEELLSAKRGTLTVEMNGIGVVVPADTVYSSFRIDGKLSEVLVQPGDLVKKGDVLLRLDAGNFDLQFMQQQLAIENAQAALTKSVATGQLDDIRIDRTTLEIEQMKLDRMLERKRQLVLTAPADGIVTFMDSIQVGSPVAAFREMIGVASTDRLQIKYIGDLSSYLNDIEIGMPADIQYKGTQAKAKVAVTPKTAPLDLNPQRAAVRSKTLLFEFTDVIPAGLFIGDYVEFRLVLKEKKDTLILPRGAIRTYQGRDFVQIVQGDTRRETDVVRGLMTPTEVEIVSGLAEGDQIAR